MKIFALVPAIAAIAALPIAGLGGAPAGVVVGWGTQADAAAKCIPFYGWAEPAVRTNSALLSKPVLGTGPLLTNGVSVACGVGFGLALLADGRVAGWGWNYFGQATGNPGPYEQATNGLWQSKGATLAGVVAVAAGRTHTLALLPTGKVLAWGEMEGPGSSAGPPDTLKDVVAISAGWFYDLALRRDGTVVDWPGSRIPTPLSNVVAIASSRNPYPSGLVLRRDGTVFQWGWNDEVESMAAGLSNVVAIAAGAAHFLALHSNGTVEGWGVNSVGQATGVYARGGPFRTNGVVMLEGQVLTNVVAIATGDRCSLALRRDGTVAAWGFLEQRPISVPAGLSNVVAIAGGDSFCLAITTNAAAFSSKK